MGGKGASKPLLPLVLNGHQVVSRFLPAIRTFQFAAAEWGLRPDREEVIQKSSLWYFRVYKTQFAVPTSQDPSRHFCTKTAVRLNGISEEFLRTVPRNAPLCGGTLIRFPLNDGFSAAIFLCFAGLCAPVSLRFDGLNG